MTDSKVAVKKRGRKPREKTYSVNSKCTEADRLEDCIENIILHLPVSSSDADDAFRDLDSERVLQYDPVIHEPSPYSPELNVGSFIDKTTNEKEVEPDMSKAVVAYEDKKSNRLIRTGMDLSDKKNIDTRDICCWWCCHTFTNTAVRLPISYSEGVFQGYGHFCSYNCACSYLFNSPEYADKVWNVYSLLNLMFKKCTGGSGQKIRLAPPRQDLQMFGGSLSIGEFRSCNQMQDKEFKLLIPPMTMIIPQIEETHRKEEDSLGIPVNKHKMHIATEALKIKRSKPILDHKHTLNSFMTIKKVSL